MAERKLCPQVRRLEARCRQYGIEVFFVSGMAARVHTRKSRYHNTRMCAKGAICRSGWYWWALLPGHILSSDWAYGPFASPSAACEDALLGIDDEEQAA